MRSLQSHHIVDLFVLVDEIVREPNRPRGGRPKLVTDSEINTLLIWNCLTHTSQRTLKDVFYWVLMYHHRDVPKLGTYGAFVAHCHRLLPQLLELLGILLVPAEIQLVDSTKIPVCRNHRANNYKVAKEPGLALNYMPPLTYRVTCQPSASPQLTFTTVRSPSVSSGRKRSLWLVIRITAAELTGRSSGVHGVIVVAPVHYTQKTQLMAEWQQVLLNLRAKIESTFDALKEHLPLVSSFPRSLKGYLLHYVRILLGYQMGMGF